MLRPLPVFVLAVASMTLLASRTSPASESPVCTGLCASSLSGSSGIPSPLPQGLALQRLAQVTGGGSDGAYRVQLAAYRAERGARSAWRRLVEAYPDLLASLDASIERADLGSDKGVVFQLRVGPFRRTAAADGLCRELKSRGADCFVVAAMAADRTAAPKDRSFESLDAVAAAPAPLARPLEAGSVPRETGVSLPNIADPGDLGDHAAASDAGLDRTAAAEVSMETEATPPAEAVEPAPSALAGRISGFIAPELRVFPDSAQFSSQDGTGVSLAIQPEYDVEWDDGAQNLGITVFARIDQSDDRRTHFDLREFRWQYAGDGWDLRLGVDKVFWGATESNHLIDIINQTDLIENPDMEDKLGQPMVNLSLIRDWGTVELFYLPYFRERTFPGSDGRLRTLTPVDVDRADFEADAEELHPDWAVRWSRSFGAWDLGLANFYGTSREPRLLPRLNGAGNLTLVPRYDLINQTSLDLQGNVGDALLKLEAMTRSGHGKRIFAVAGGFEYTLYGIAESMADLGLLLEVSYDDRNDDSGTTAPPTLFDNDVFTGLRFGLNDVQGTEILAGVVTDWRSGARAVSVEASRRIGDRSKLSLEARTFDGFPASDFFGSLRQDDHLRLEFTFFF